MVPDVILTCNAGSSSIKFALFEANESLPRLFYGEIEDIPDSPIFWVKDTNGNELLRKEGVKSGHKQAVAALFEWVDSHDNRMNIIAAGHRVVHGGREFSEPVVITDEVIEKLEALIPLAPLHQSHNLEAIREFATLHPSISQIACFDTAFHRTQSPKDEIFALPHCYGEEGVLRYGFHGLSYEYIASVLPDYVKDKENGRVIVAHLGNGASMCAMNERKSVATTMGFTALDGLMMGTRCGNIDPGIILYLMEEKALSIKEVTNLLYKESGLKGVSGISHDMRDLLASNAPQAKEAIDLFCYQAAKQLGSLIPSLGGLDVLVFTAGIGEHSPQIRKNICDYLSWLGVYLGDEANEKNNTMIHTSKSHVAVYVLATDEERMIAIHTHASYISRRG